MRKNEKMNYTPRVIFNWLNEFVKGQDAALQKISTALSIHINASYAEAEDVTRSNILIVGPTGCGKTETIRGLMEMDLAFPVISVTALSYSVGAWQGTDFNQIFTLAFKQAKKKVEEDMGGKVNDDEVRFLALEATKHSIIVIDEFDKISKNNRGGNSSSDSFASDYQHTLLGILEGGTEVPVEVTPATQSSPAMSARISTKNMQYILMGAFAGLEEITKKRVAPPAQIGFKSRENYADKSDLTPNTDDLVAYGFSRELIGRIPVHAKYNHLSADQLVNIMKNAANSPITKLEKRLEVLNFDLIVSEMAYEILAEKSIKQGTGARGIESLLASIVYPTLYGEADGSHKQILIGANAANGYEPPSVAKVSDSDLVLNEIFKKRKKK